MIFVESIQAVQPVHPEATVEWPDRMGSISGVPRGAELSRRCSHPKAAWMDAARKLDRRKGSSK